MKNEKKGGNKTKIKKKIEVDFLDLLRIIFYLGLFLANNFFHLESLKRLLL